LGNLVSADPPQQSTTVDREQYKVSLADPEFLLGDIAEANLVGKRLFVHLAIIDPTTGLPLLGQDNEGVADAFNIYTGSIDGGAYDIDTRELGESLFQVTGVSPILSLEMKSGIYLSKDAVRQRNPNDSCCDSLYDGSAAVVLKWGKK
jgi:hypothetical protein